MLWNQKNKKNKLQYPDTKQSMKRIYKSLCQNEIFSRTIMEIVITIYLRQHTPHTAKTTCVFKIHTHIFLVYTHLVATFMCKSSLQSDFMIQTLIL